MSQDADQLGEPIFKSFPRHLISLIHLRSVSDRSGKLCREVYWKKLQYCSEFIKSLWRRLSFWCFSGARTIALFDIFCGDGGLPEPFDRWDDAVRDGRLGGFADGGRYQGRAGLYCGAQLDAACGHADVADGDHFLAKFFGRRRRQRFLQ